MLTWLWKLCEGGKPKYARPLVTAFRDSQRMTTISRVPTQRLTIHREPSVREIT
jgi:hypothetical protein